MGKYFGPTKGRPLPNPSWTPSVFDDAAKAQIARRVRERAEKKALMEKAEAALELRRRFENSKVSFYHHCCKTHGKTCSTHDCPDSIHAAFHRSQKRIRVFYGGNRSGKSCAGLMEMLFRSTMKTHPYTKIANRVPSVNRIFCSDFAVIEKIILPMVYEWIPKDSLKNGAAIATKREAWDKAYDPKYHILELAQGSTIDFMSYDQDTSKAASVELDNVWADEEMPERLYSETMGRLVSRDGRFWMTVTPLYSLTWAMRFMDEDDPEVEVFHAEIFDNPHLSKKSVDTFIRTIPEHEREARIYGRFLELQGLVYKELRRDVHLISPSKPFSDMTPERKYPVIMAMDPHPRKATVVGWAFVSPQEDVVFFDELEMQGTAAEIAFAIRQKEELHEAPTVHRIIDPAAKGQGSNLAFQTDTLQEFEREGLSFSLADNSEAGYNVVHEYLGWDSKQGLSSTNRPRCFFSTDCPKTWYGMTHLSWDEYKFGRTLRDAKEHVKDYKKDFPDIVRYTLVTRPKFKMSLTPVPLGNAAVLNPKYQERPVRQFILGGSL